MSARVGVFGATGYSGREIVRLLQTHPRAHVAFTTGSGSAGIISPYTVSLLQGLQARFGEDAVTYGEVPAGATAANTSAASQAR